MSTGTESAQGYDVDRRKEGDRAADGKSAAAEKLFSDSRDANKAGNGGQFDNQTIAKLEQQGILPQLAIEFTKTADTKDLDGDGNTTESVYSAIDTDGKNGITADEIAVARTSQNASVLDKRLLQQLGNDYETLRFTTITGQDGISEDDVNSYIATSDGALTNDTRVRDASARLLLNPDLFNAADTASDGGTGDGSISKDDLKTLIDKYGKGELPSSVSQDDIKAMQFLVDNWDQSFVGGDNSGIRDTKGDRDTQSGTGLTRASIQIGLGLPADGTGNQTLFDQVNGVDSGYGQQYAAAYSSKYGQDFPSSEDTSTTSSADVPSPTSGNPSTDTTSSSTSSEGDMPSPTSGNPVEQPVSTTDANGANITSYQGAVTEVAYPSGQARDFGYGDDGKLVGYKDADGTAYNYKDGAWTSAADGQPAPFSDVTVDSTGNVKVTTDGITKTYDTAGNPPFEEPVHTTDANGAQVTTHRGKVTEVAYPNGEARDFGYNDNNDLVLYKDADGKVYKRDTTSSPWVGSEDGQPAPFSDVAADQAGNVTVTNADGSTATFNTKNEQQATTAADVPATTDTTATTDTGAPTDTAPATDSVGSYKVKSGQGFDVIAREVYKEALGHAPSAAEERALSELIAAANDNDRSYSGGALHTGDELVVPNLQELSQQAEQQGVPLETYIRSASQQIVTSLQTPTDAATAADNSEPVAA